MMQILETGRLKIVALTLPQLKKLLAGTPELETELGLVPSGLELDAHTREAMAYLAGLAEKTPDSYPWITNWQIIWKERGLSIGSACFMGRPDVTGTVEIGYGIHPEFQRRGFMTEALDAICGWALKQPGVSKIRAESEPDNAVSRRILQKCGFFPTDERHFVRCSGFILETERLYLREMVREDFPALCKMLQDPEVMYAYEGAFTDAEAQDWLDRQLRRYSLDGIGLWAVVLKKTNAMIGQCGLTLQPWKGHCLLEIGYLFQKTYWHKGYATEAAAACREYAFQTRNADAVYSIIRDTNQASRNVAKRNGMTAVDQSVKHYRGVDMPHILYEVKRTENAAVDEI